MFRTVSRIGSGLALPVLMTTMGVAAVTDLALSKSENNVELEWTTGSAPFRVIRSRTPRFISGNASVAESVITGRATDPGAARDRKDYFYKVLGTNNRNPPLYDLNAPRPVPVITILSPNIGKPGTNVTIDGNNFARSGSGQTVMFGSEIANVSSSTETQIIATAPPGTVTEDVVVCVVDVCSNHVRFTVTVGDGEAGR